MKKILGLDLGTNSIGWAIIEIDDINIPRNIVDMGVRIVPLSADERDQFQKGQAISKNQERTTARTQRKGYNRLQLRKSDDFKYSLTKLLKEINIFPDPHLMHLPVLELWKLRHDAALENNDLTPQQLARVLYMLNQKRGYKSARSEANMDKKDTDYVMALKSRYALLQDTGLTLGQYFFKELSEAKANNRYFQVKKKVYPREAYLDEFDAIMKVQQPRHAFLTDEMVNKLRNQIIYYQRPLKSQKGLVSICEFEGFETTYKDKNTHQDKTTFTGPRVAPKSSPLFQLCKIWETVNNLSLKVKNPEGSRYKWTDRYPDFVEKQKIAEFLWQNERLDFSELLKILNLKKESVYGNKQINRGLQGNLTYAAIYKVIGDNPNLRFSTKIIPSKHESLLIDKRSGEIIEEKDSLQLDPNLEFEPLYQLWHTIYSIQDLEECSNALMKRFGITGDEALQLARIDFNKSGFGNKSNKAMRKILPYLVDGYNYADACSLAGYNHSDNMTKHERTTKVTDNHLKLLGKNSLRQPVVEKILNQMINLVNAVIDRHGKPDEIRVELARNLKQSKEERNDSFALNVANKNLHDHIALRLTELGLPVTKKNIQKYKFIFPTNTKKLKDAQVVNQCIYCGQSFSLSEALSGDNFDVDHIVPKALLFDDSQTNKVLVHRSCNTTKTNQTAYDYISKKGEIELAAYLNRVDDWFRIGIISYGKMQRLKVSFEDYLERKKQKKETAADKKLWENFINRQLRETQYIARKSREILSKVCNNVTSTEGLVTAKLRELWGWDSILMNLQLPKYKSNNQTILKEWTSQHGNRKHSKEEIANWSKRDDHRHHAIDALVVACTRQGFIQRINTLNASDTKDEMNREIESAKIDYNEKLTLLEKYLISQKPFSTVQIESQASQILVSIKTGKKAATTGVRKIKQHGEKHIVQTGIIVPRGALHEQFVYGKIKVQERNKPLKYLFENSDRIANPAIKKMIKDRIAENNDSIKSALSSAKKSPIWINAEHTQKLEGADCFNDEYVIKYKIEELKLKDVPFIVDLKVKQLVQDRLAEYNGNEKEAFKNVIWFNEAKKIPIISVRCFTGLSAVEVVKKNGSGKAIGFAKPGSNHHIAIYKDADGKIHQHACTFWHAVERKKYKLPVLIRNTQEVWNTVINQNLPQSFIHKLPPDKLQLQYSLQENEMYILDMSTEDFERAISSNNKTLLSKHLYLVWSVSFNKYWFKHHLETKNSELKKTVGARESRRFVEVSSIEGFYKLNPIKVKIDYLGTITKIGE